MKTNIEINSLVKAAVNGELIKRAAGTVIEGETDILSDGCDIEVSVIIVGPKKIQEINKKYRKKNQVTDVLSFAEGNAMGRGEGLPRILGELAICLKQVRDDAKESGKSVEYELAWVVVHGMLHLLGYDHETSKKDAIIMRQKEQFYLSQCKNVF